MSGAWTPAKVDAFRKAFFEFLKVVRINSKEKGGGYILADGVYEAQRRFLGGVFAGLSEDKHDFSVLKSRQLGISTISRALVVFYLGVTDGIQGAAVLDTDVHKEEYREEIESIIDNLPPSVKFPRIKKRNRNMITLENGSVLRLLSAGVKQSKSGGVLGRSSGINLVHGSEMCSWENEEGVTALKNALAEDFPDRLYIWESTARGFNRWHTMWEEAKADTLNKVAIFIGWWAKDNQKIERGTEAFEKYGTAPPTEKERQRIAEVLERYGHQVTDEQLAWYRRKTDPANSKEDDDEDDPFTLQDQPWTEDEAFQMSGSSFFAADRLTERAKEALREKYTGYRFFPGTDFVSCDFHRARTIKDSQLKIWEEPDPHGVYVVAADPAYGHDEQNDRSACQVIRCYADCVEQVAEFASASTPTNQFAWLIASVVGYYKNVGSLIIEINGPGEAVWNEYKSLKQIVTQGYLRGAAQERGIRDIFNNVRNYIFSRSDSMSASNSLMWKTQTQLKVAIMERLRDFTNSGHMLIRSMETIEEMRSVTRDGDVIKAQGRKKDDRVLALAMAIRAWEERVRKTQISNNQTKAAAEARKMTSPQSRAALLNKYQMDTFFRQKERSRVQAKIAARRAMRGR